jgi:hypothetical protein
VTREQRGIALVVLCGIMTALGVMAAVRHDWFFFAADVLAMGYLFARINGLRHSSVTPDE